MKGKKKEAISDEMVGHADPVCTCAATVGEIILTKNVGDKNRASLKAIKKKLEKNRNPSKK
ncbi:MAG TPA: hypothetical protein DCO77_01880 [Nitrospiraceae bacterium]|nr:hypothetical protein [Nitrospiraceae bacterium]